MTPRFGRRAGDARDDAGRGHDAVVGAEHARAQPVQPRGQLRRRLLVVGRGSSPGEQRLGVDRVQGPPFPPGAPLSSKGRLTKPRRRSSASAAGIPSDRTQKFVGSGRRTADSGATSESGRVGERLADPVATVRRFPWTTSCPTCPSRTASRSARRSSTTSTHPTWLLAARRTEPPALAGGWEFPGGKVEPGEEAGGALHREIREELGVSVRAGPGGPRPGRRRAGRSGERYLMRVWLAEVSDGRPAADGGARRAALAGPGRRLSAVGVAARRPAHRRAP